MAISEIHENAKNVLEKRYLKRDADGTLTEDIEGMFRRVASAVASADKNYNPDADISRIAEEFYTMMSDLRFLPNSPTLMNAGRPLGQLSACFVLPIEDSMEAIFETIKNAALIHKSGGGTGFSFSRLRQSGASVNSTGGVASGPVSFMKVFNMATEAVKQGGTRRGANMGILRVDHPDILSFIDCKKDNADLTNFNISIGITESFMQSVETGENYNLIDPHSKRPSGRLNAKEVFEHIIDAAWRNGEPGIVFLDRLNRDNVVPSLGEIEATNPCGEQPLLPYESCNLGSINLVKMVSQDRDGVCNIDWELLCHTVYQAVHFLDNVIDINNYPLAAIAEITRATRKIGLGIMGWADMLLMLDIPYNSEKALQLAETMMARITHEGRLASRQLASIRGSFPQFENSAFKNDPPLRNATITTIAPTGTLSIIAGCSSGIEPVFAFAYTRNIMDGTEMTETNPILQKKLEALNLFSPDMMHRIAKEGSILHNDSLPKELREVFVCAHDISPLYHIRMQAAFQKFTDNAVSKTVNFPRSATRDDVAQVYHHAFKEGCKGVTIYRDGSRDSQVLNIGEVNKTGSEQREPASPRPRPEITSGFTERMKIGCGNLYVTVNYDDSGICEIFTSTGKAGGCPSQSEATARMCSIALRSGIPVQEIYAQLKGIRCPSTIRNNGMSCTSCPDAIAKVVMKVHRYIEEKRDQPSLQLKPEPLSKSRPGGGSFSADENAEPLSHLSPVGSRMSCPDCSGALEHEGGCVVCRNCGFSKCG